MAKYDPKRPRPTVADDEVAPVEAMIDQPESADGAGETDDKPGGAAEEASSSADETSPGTRATKEPVEGSGSPRVNGHDAGASGRASQRPSPPGSDVPVVPPPEEGTTNRAVLSAVIGGLVLSIVVVVVVRLRRRKA